MVVGARYTPPYVRGRVPSTFDGAAQCTTSSSLRAIVSRCVSRSTASIQVQRSSGGLAAALDAVRATRPGWGGRERSSPALQKRADRRLSTDHLHPVFLSAEEEEDFYGKVCNDTLWPLFHYFQGRLRITPEAWAAGAWRSTSASPTRSSSCAPDARVWNARLPSHARAGDAARPRATGCRSGSSYTSFPHPREVYRLLPGESLLRGAQADYVSFQVGDYARHFRSSCLRMLGIDSEPDWLELDGRRVGIGVDPIGIDVAGFREVIADRDGTWSRPPSSTPAASSCSASSASTTKAFRRSSWRSSASSNRIRPGLAPRP